MSGTRWSRWIPLAAFVLVGSGALLLASPRAVEPPGAAVQSLDLDQGHAEIEIRDYMRNVDRSVRELFSNSGPAVGITLIGTKNLALASTMRPEVGPVEIRAGVDLRHTILLGVIPREQPRFAVRVLVPEGAPGKTTVVYLWNSDEGQTAILDWKLIVD